MLPGHSHQIPAMGMPPGYAPMMQWDDPNCIPQQMIMMTAPTGQQIALTSVYPMPQNAMMPGQQRFMPPPPPYNFQMASGFRDSAVRNNDPQMTDEQRRKMEKELKQRQFVEQQRRLQGLSNLGSVKMDPDKLIESIIGKTETVHKAPANKLPNVALAKGIDPGEDVFGDFLSSSAVKPSQIESHQTAAASPAAKVSGYLGPQQLQKLGNNVMSPIENSAQSLTSEVSSVKNTVDAPKERKDLASMMMQCSDLTAPKEARRFEKKKTVKEIQVTKAVSITYNESKTARHWDSNTETLSELFTLPANLASQPTVTFEPFEANATMTSEFRLPPWVTGEIPVHSLYQKALEAVTRDNVILTELVYPLLLQSGLPREALGYIWELCNRQTPGQLIREELFLILAMISVAQNGFDYSSLAILSKCPQPPVPNLGQFLSSPTPQQAASFFGPAAGEPSIGSAPAAMSSSTFPGTATMTSGMVEPTVYSQGTVPKPTADPSVSSVTGESRHPLAYAQNTGHTTHGAAEYLHIGGFSGHHPAASIPVVPLSAVDDDDFEEFQAAPLPSLGLSHVSFVNAGSAVPVNVSSYPPASRGAEFELMKMEEDKYAAFRELSSLSSMELETDVAVTALENPVTSPVADLVAPCSTADSDFTDFASFSDASTSDIPLSVVSTTSNSDSLHQSHLASSSNFAIINQERSEFSSFDSQVNSYADNSQVFAAVKSLINDPSVFATKSFDLSSNSHATSVAGNSVDVHKLFVDSAAVRVEGDDGWAEFSRDGYLSPRSDQNCLSATVAGCPEPSDVVNVSKVSEQLPDSEGWAEFESASSLRNDHVIGTKQCSTLSNDPAFPSGSKPVTETKIKFDAASDKVQRFFGQVNSNRGATTGVGVSPLDFHPPELPDEDDDFDDFAMYPAYPKDGNSAAGISSLSMHYLDDDRPDSLSEEKNASSTVNGKTSTMAGMTQSNSSNSLEFTGWKLQSTTAVKEPDVHSTSSLELRQNKITDFRDESPQQDGDSQSVSSLDFPQIESEQKSTTDEQSVASFELKPTSPESDPTPSGESSTSDKTHPSVETLHSGFNFKESGQGHPVDLKELLEQGSLGIFGDRYSELTNEVQDSDRHAYEWQRCLEICNGFLSEGNSIFGSLSSSSVLREILSTNEGSTYLKGLVEIYFVARRIEEEMRFVSVSNSKLASILKEINIEWSDIATICAGSPMMPDSTSLNFQSSFLKADDYEARRKACGVCLLNVDVKTPDISPGDSGSKALGYGGRQYHTACANFWINCVSKTLPSLTIPELL